MWPSTATGSATSRSGWTTPATPSPRPSPAGRSAVQEPTVLDDDQGKVVIAAIRTYGDTIHSIVERHGISRALPPRLRPDVQHRSSHPTVGLQYVDHCVGQRRAGQDERVGRLLSRRARLQPAGELRRQGHLDRVFGPHVEGDGQRQSAGSSSRSTSRPRAARRARSTSTSSSIAGPACSTSPSPPTTSSRPCRSCRPRGRVPAGPLVATTTPCSTGSARSTRPSSRSGSSAS